MEDSADIELYEQNSR